MAANWSLSQVFTQMNNGARWPGSSISYGFPTSSSGLFTLQGEATGFRPMNSAQQAIAVLALATWDDLIPQTMVQRAPGSTDIEFGYTNTGIGFAHGYYPPRGSIFFLSSADDLVNPKVGNYGSQTFIHEIGHTLGLNHMGNYDGNGNWSPSSFQDSVVLSIMSYFGPRSAAPNYSPEVMLANWTGADGVVYSPQTPMVNDIYAIQAIYGTATDTRVGNTVYGFNSTVTGITAQLYDFRVNRNPILSLFDSSGIDTLDLSGFSQPGRVDLGPGAFSNVNGMTNNISIAFSAVIENAIGGPGADSLTGNAAGNRLEGGGGNDDLFGLAGDDVLVGGAGNDLFDGGAGSDTALFFGNYFAYTITITGNTVLIASASEGNDRALSIERFQFADGLRLLSELSPAGDTAAPALQSLYPADNDAAVPTGANLVLRFNEGIKAGSGNITLFNSDGSVLGSIAAGDTSQVRFDGNSVTIDPALTLGAGRSYFVQVGSGAFTDLAGNAFAGIAGSTAWNFSTASTDTVAPQLLALSPADNAAAVGAGTDLVLQFNEPVVRGSGNVVIHSGTQVLRTIPITDTAQVTFNGNAVTVNPAANLPQGAAVYVTVDAGALRDAAGNAFAGITNSSSWNFTLAATAADDFPYDTGTPGVVAVNGSPTGGVIEVGGDLDLFAIQLSAGVAYTFGAQRTAASGLADPYLVLWSPILNLLAEDDDSGGAGNAQLSFTPASSGTYYLAVMDYASTGTGAYTVSAATQDAVPPTLTGRSPADNAAAVPVSTELVLNFSEPVLAGTGQIRIITASGAVLREFHADNAQAVHISGNSVRISTGTALPADAQLSVVIDATAFRDVAGNPYAGISSLTEWNFSTAANTTTDDFPMLVSTPGSVGVNGVSAPGTINFANDGDLFRVALTAGVTYRFEMVSDLGSAIDPFLMLYGRQPKVELVAYDDDSGPRTFDARLFFTPSASGEYYLAAFDYAEAIGRYSINAITPVDDFVGSTATNGRLTIETTGVRGRIDAPSDRDMFALTLQAGQAYSFELQAAGTSALSDPYLILTDGSGNQLSFDDDTGIGLDALLSYIAPVSGTYYLAAAGYGIDTGDYQLSGYSRNLIHGSAGNDALQGSSARDALDSGAGNDLLRPGPGDDVLWGGSGIDTGRFLGATSNYLVQPLTGGGWLIRDLVGTEGRDLAYDVERVQFDDSRLAIDIDGHAGTTVKLLGAVFGAAAVDNKAYVGIGLTLLDGGMSDTALTQLALEARLGVGASAATVVNLLWSNLFGNLPDTSTRLSYEQLITGGVLSAADLALLAADTDWNLENIDLVGIAETGIAYTV
ncbi:MAG: Ig-like domain-containing protein [Rubrivivax sp.]|nr:Ig-like domain-containing protein [Rubrivivax sp.]MBK8526546.1 Ig-like domain-containing protein [Rubrivivax sp.]